MLFDNLGLALFWTVEISAEPSNWHRISSGCTTEITRPILVSSAGATVLIATSCGVGDQASSSAAVVVLEHSAESLAAINVAHRWSRLLSPAFDQRVAQALMIPLGVIVGQVLDSLRCSRIVGQRRSSCSSTRASEIRRTSQGASSNSGFVAEARQSECLPFSVMTETPHRTWCLDP